MSRSVTTPGANDERVAVLSDERLVTSGELHELAQRRGERERVDRLSELIGDGPHVGGVGLAGEGGNVGRTFAVPG